MLVLNLRIALVSALSIVVCSGTHGLITVTHVTPTWGLC